MTSLPLLAVVFWLAWRFLATPATTTAQQLRAMAYSLAPIAALAVTAVALLKVPWAAKQHLLLQLLASAPKASTEATLELQLACAAPAAPSMTVARPPLESMTVKQLRALARLQGHAGRLVSHGKRADLLLMLSL